ncbi:MAG: transcription-repair coupling factor [Planctomycetales bacterium 4572_13]|nr:MAG: transcription-repair coupling factor [Planctomycetales bacterium 4572_13]
MDLDKDKTVCGILARLADAPSQGPVNVSGTWGSFAPALAAHLWRSLKRPVLYISPHIDDADNAADDLQVFAGLPVQTFPVWESPDEITDATDEILAQRLRMSLWLSEQQQKKRPELFLISTSVQALNQPVAKPQTLVDQGLSLSVNQTIEPELLTGWLIDHGFEPVDRVDVPGQFAHRGGIVDIFAPICTATTEKQTHSSLGEPEPVRIEFFGDQIETLRRIDLDTQLSGDTLLSIQIAAAQPTIDPSGTELLLNLLPAETLIVLEEPIEIEEVAGVFLSRLDDPRGMYPWSAVYKAAQKFTCLQISRFGITAKPDFQLDITSTQPFEHKSGTLWKDQQAALEQLITESKDQQVLFYCENQAEVQRVREILREKFKHIPSNFKLLIGFIHRGFILRSLNTIVVTHHEIFGQVSIRRRVRRLQSVSAVDSMLDLKKGDFVVHISYGIGKFIGVKMLEKSGAQAEYITLEYADKIQIHVPVTNIGLIQKFIGSTPKRPALSKIGTKKWEKQKENVAKGIEEMAAALLEAQAKREKLGGFNFGDDTIWQREFEESFPYQETPDQITAVAEIKDNMASDRPMDRLLCGDVGYGKTELAMRAAFKAIGANKQVAVLVPTTVLCVQHGRSFKERFADFPITVEVVNRFTTAKQAKEILAACRTGRVDILIGTHRLLSDDVGFKDLGLLIVDEEQRFGVKHKERLKRFRINVDILTMTATPIPRTLHMSMIGLRDISSLSTPPLDRRAVVTKVARYSEETIRKAILFEINRDGQIFFLYNRVQTIERFANEIAQIVGDPSVKIDIAHGQMAKHELEDAMIRFIAGDTGVLICSTIIESGIDIPNANTILIADADRFGLAQLHQLRGRVGRYKHRAYAYMLLPKSRSITPLAGRRLKAIEEYSQLGAGFRIALRDLEIRGAGNILGPEQSGHINTVGYELYCRLLGDAVKRLRNEPVEKEPETVVDLGFASYIPKSYIPSDRQRMEVYRRVSAARNIKDIDRLKVELRDLFGRVPEQVTQLLELAQIRLRAAKWNIRSIIVQRPDVIFSFPEDASATDLFARYRGTVRIPDPRTVHIRLDKNYFEPKTLLAVLRKLLQR